MNEVTAAARIRGDAARIVAEVMERGRSLDELLAGETDEGSARGLKRSLCYGTLRWHLRLAAILKALVERPPEKLQPQLRALIEVGLYQLVSGDVAPHAAVSETVNATRATRVAQGGRLRQRRAAAVPARAGGDPHAVDRDLSVRTAHPRWFVEALRRQRADVFEAVLDANNRIRRCGCA